MFDEPFLLIGHRGAAGLEPENTLPSFERAVELGVSAVELDVHVVANELFVIHDETLDRTTNGAGPVADLSPAELRTLDAGNGAAIPTLAQVLEVIPHEVGINVELKGIGTAAPAIAFIEQLTDERTILLSSFRHEELTTARTLSSTVPIAPLFGRKSRNMFDVAEKLDAWSVNVSSKLASRELIDDAHELGYRVLVYTVNDPDDAQRLHDYGVDGLFTDRPDLLNSALNL